MFTNELNLYFCSFYYNFTKNLFGLFLEYLVWISLDFVKRTDVNINIDLEVDATVLLIVFSFYYFNIQNLQILKLNFSSFRCF